MKVEAMEMLDADACCSGAGSLLPIEAGKLRSDM